MIDGNIGSESEGIAGLDGHCHRASTAGATNIAPQVVGRQTGHGGIVVCVFPDRCRLCVAHAKCLENIMRVCTQGEGCYETELHGGLGELKHNGDGRCDSDGSVATMVVVRRRW